MAKEKTFLDPAKGMASSRALLEQTLAVVRAWPGATELELASLDTSTDLYLDMLTNYLNVDKFANGDPIPRVDEEEEWIKAGDESRPAWCYYENSDVYGGKYGKLYNWFAVNDRRGIAPLGYRVLSIDDYERLTSEYWDLRKDYRKWRRSVDKSNRFVSVNFTKLQYFGGMRSYGRFRGWGDTARFWSRASDRAFWLFSGPIGIQGIAESAGDHKSNGYSVLCIQQRGM